MTIELIEGMREVVLPFVAKKLLEINYENLGASDADEFSKYFNEILDLAIEALKQPTDVIYLTREAYADLCLRAAKAGDLEMELAEKKAEPCEDCDKWETDKTACQKCGEPCEDAVSREAVLDVLHVEGRPTKRFDYVIDVKRDIMALPPVTPKQRTGKWIETTVVIDEFTNEEDTFYVCGCCNERICQPHKYCPNCGAKMEGERE